MPASTDSSIERDRVPRRLGPRVGLLDEAVDAALAGLRGAPRRAGAGRDGSRERARARPPACASAYPSAGGPGPRLDATAPRLTDSRRRS